MNEKFTSFWQFLGLAVRAGKVVTGNENVSKALLKNKGFLLILTTDIAPQSAKKLMNLAKKNNLDTIVIGQKEELGHWTGKDLRVAALVSDRNFADRLKILANTKIDTEAKI